jgi:SWI/SNF-related matrix-associated actin-dependent regulator of chromatin subfamily A-like protein 1
MKEVKSFPAEDRRFIPTTKEWEIIYRDEYVKKLRELNFDIDTILYNKCYSQNVDDAWKKIKIPKEYDYLFDYQKDVLRFSEYHNNRILVALEMGGGKSITSLSIMDRIDQFPTIIVCPSSVKNGFKREYYKFINKDDRIKMIESSSEMIDYKDEYDIFIINYDILARNIKKVKEYFYPNDRLENFFKNNIKCAILDEIHKIKNPDAKTSNAIHYILKNTKNIIALTGTPILSSSKDLFMILNLLRPDLFPNYWKFCNRFCNIKINYKAGRVKEFYGARNSSELNSILLNEVMFRLTKEDMGTVLDKPLISVIPISMKNNKKYKELENSISDDSGFSIMDKLKKEAWEQKKESFYEILEEFLEETDEKIVLFYHNKNVGNDIQEKFPNSVKIDGTISTKGDTRDKIIDKFMEDKDIRIILGSIGAMGLGVDRLQFCSSIAIFVQWSWVSSEINQAVSRIHRTGQKKLVNVYHYPTENTIEETFMKILDRKEKMFREVIDNRELSEKEMLEEIMKITKRNNNRGKS